MRIEISNKKTPDINDLIYLFKQAGWHDKTDARRIKSMIENSTIIVTAWDNEKMVGFARCMTDYTFNGQINNVVVDKKYRGQGIGRKLVDKIIKSSEKVTYILRADPENIGFYKRMGFKDAYLSVVYEREK